MMSILIFFSSKYTNNVYLSKAPCDCAADAPVNDIIPIVVGAVLGKSKINNNTDRLLDVVFSRFRGFSFTITLKQKPKEITRMLSLCFVNQRGMRDTPMGFCFLNQEPSPTYHQSDESLHILISTMQSSSICARSHLTCVTGCLNKHGN